MTTPVIPVEPVLSPEEYAELDRAAAQPGLTLSDLARFLATRFNLDLTLDRDIVGGFAADSSNLPGRAQALCRPASEHDCAVILHACHKAGIPHTLSAGKSNLTGSATPEDGVIISTVNLQTPTPSIDAVNRTTVAPVGLILEDFRRQVLELSGGTLIYPVDPTSRADASIGGTLACNASGFTPGEAGATRPWVAAIDFLLPDGWRIRAARGQYVSADGFFHLHYGDGRIVDLPVPNYPRPAIKNAGGPFSASNGIMDFVDLVVGSEGLFGLVTACRLSLQPHPPAVLDLFFPLPGEPEALKFFHFLHTQMAGRLECLSAFEYFGVNCRKYMDHENALFQGNNQVGINLQVPLMNADALDSAAEEWLERILSADCGVDPDAILLLDNDRVRKLFMEARHSLPAKSLEVVQHRGTFTIMTDAVVPPNRFDEFLAFTHNLIRSAGIDYLSFGHLGDCHLHFTLLPEKSQLDRGREIYDQIVARSADLGGVYSGEHGTGKRKRQDFLRCYGPAGVASVRQCKAALDPRFLLNRGNVVEYMTDVHH
jgi:D-lactate dehydrogenase (cytochrome)